MVSHWFQAPRCPPKAGIIAHLSNGAPPGSDGVQGRHAGCSRASAHASHPTWGSAKACRPTAPWVAACREAG